MIDLQNVSKQYPMGKTVVHALRNVSMHIDPGEFVAIMGRSGSGKSTLLHIIGFLDRPDSGSYVFAGKDVTKLTDKDLAVLRNRLMGFVFQMFYLLPRATSLENVSLPLMYGSKKQYAFRAEKVLNEVGLSNRKFNRSNELSGGEQQRVAIARSLVNDPLIVLADEPTGNLDSKSEEEIISILEHLHHSGKTIIMVTHEEELAARAQRIIRMRDGEIVSDSGKLKVQKQPASSVSVSFDELFSRSQAAFSKARFADHLRQAASAIITHKMRSFLSMLGILIGVGAVIAMLALGKGAQESVLQRLSSLGSNLLTVRPGAVRRHGVALQAGSVTRLVLKDADAIAKHTEVIKSVSPLVFGRGQIVYGNKNWTSHIIGSGTAFSEIRAFVPTFGRFFIDEEVRLKKRVAVIGVTVAEELFGDENPVGATVKINRLNFKVIGVLPSKGSSTWRDRDDLVLVPVTTAMSRLFGKKYIDSIDVEVRSFELIEQAQKHIRNIIKKNHPTARKNDKSFSIHNMTELQEAVKSATRTMTLLGISIAGISLFVGGIGIMNVMLVSVTERIREIGLRKAVGANSRDILMQFLIEAIIMTLIGGMLGILVGVIVAYFVGMLDNWPTKISFSSIIISTSFSIAVGLIFGILPARQAARLNPIVALRYE